VGNVMMGSAYNFRRATEGASEANSHSTDKALEVINLTNFSVALALQAGAMGVPFLPTRTAMGSDVARNNHFFYQILSPFQPQETLYAVRALVPDVTIVHVQRADKDGNAHCWGNFGVMIEAVRAAKKVIVVAEEIVAPEVIASDPNRTVIPGFLVTAVVESPHGAHPSPVQGYYKRDDAAFKQYHESTKTAKDFENWAKRWIYGVRDRAEYLKLLGDERVEALAVKQHAYAAETDYGY
jgi:glutaconate CoA-transferase subunit A